MKFHWFASYRGCGCSTDAPQKKDILNYCGKHGSSLYKCFAMAIPKISKMQSAKEGEK